MFHRGRGVPKDRRKAVPQWNGRVEFWNFLDCDLTVKAVSGKLLKHEFFYNYERPHSALDYLAPNEYLVAQEAALAPVP